MSEPKMCPMGYLDIAGFSLCQEEKCAWWIKEKRWTTEEEQRMWGVKEIGTGGHCAALDWGKK